MMNLTQIRIDDLPLQGMIPNCGPSVGSYCTKNIRMTPKLKKVGKEFDKCRI